MNDEMRIKVLESFRKAYDELLEDFDNVLESMEWDYCETELVDKMRHKHFSYLFESQSSRPESDKDE